MARTIPWREKSKSKSTARKLPWRNKSKLQPAGRKLPWSPNFKPNLPTSARNQSFSDALFEFQTIIMENFRELLLHHRTPERAVKRVSGRLERLLDQKISDKFFTQCVKYAFLDVTVRPKTHLGWTEDSQKAFLKNVILLAKNWGVHWTQSVPTQLISTKFETVETIPVKRTEAQAQRHSTLLTLPRNLRKKVYSHVVANSLQQRDGELVVPGLIFHLTQQPAITKTCRACRSEALPAFYSRNVFVFQIDDHRFLKRAQQWVSLMRRHIKYMQDIVIIGFDYVDLDDKRPKDWRPFQIGVNLRKLAVTGLITDHEDADDHLTWKRIMLEQMGREVNGSTVTAKLLSKLLASFAQDFGDMSKLEPRMEVNEPVFSSGLGMCWKVWPGQSF